MRKLIATVVTTTLTSITSANPAVSSFYDAVSMMQPNGKLGQILKIEKIKTSIANAQAWRIAYVSSDVSERKTISTALVVAPIGKYQSGGRPVMAWAHGTTGSAQNCGPSQILDPAVPLNQYFLLSGNSWSDYGLPGVNEFIREGYVVVGTDYQGLGGGGKHQYSVAASNARDVINSIRAVNTMNDTGAGKKAIVYGWSQGGGATLAAASIPNYIEQSGTAADNIKILGFVAMAPDDLAVRAPDGTIDQAGADKLFAGLESQFSDNIFNFTHLAMFLWGTQAAFPNLKLTDLFTDDGAKIIDTMFTNKCMHVASDTFNFLYGSNYKKLLKQPENTQAWAEALLKGSVSPVKPVAPVMIYFGDKDTTVPPIMGKLYQEQMCKLGGNVGRAQLPGEQNHFTTPDVAKTYYLPWVKDRFAGVPLKNACPNSN